MPPTHDQPLVSAIIPVYNCQSYLAEAIDSALAQTYRSLEIIIVDDGSTDDSAKVAARYASAVSYCHQPHAGISAARNRGIGLAQGSFLSFLDSDDLWLEDKTALQIAAFDQDPSLDMVLGQAMQFRDTGEAAAKAPNGLGDAMPGHVPGAIVIRRTSFFRVGLFSTEWRVGEWADWYLRATECGLKSVTLPQVVLKRRLHENNIGIRKQDLQVQYVRVLKASLDRRRKKGQLGPAKTVPDSELGPDHE